MATLGPASNTLEAIRQLAAAGADVFRLNFSHGRHEDHLQFVRHIRALETQLARPLTILADLQGPKFRVGRFKEGAIHLVNGARFSLDHSDAPGDETRVQLPHPEVLDALVRESAVLLDDGRIRLRVVAAEPGRVETEVVHGGRLSDRKGVNLPDVAVGNSALTAKDRQDLALALAAGVDWIALSFVQSARDIADLRDVVQDRALIAAKIEKPQALDVLECILDLADGLMVARGDLAVETAAEDVPVLQRRIVNACRRRGKPVIIATQMLESMTSAPVPTRAEASDVASAVYQRVDAVMLSAESASGSHPVAAVQMMDRICRRVEADLADPHHEASCGTPPPAEVIGAALRAAAGATSLAATVTYTTSGESVRKVARERPSSPLVAVTPSLQVARRLGLVWGVHAWVSKSAHGADELVQVARQAAAECLPLSSQGKVAVVAGLPFGTLGAINFLHILPPASTDPKPEAGSPPWNYISSGLSPR